MVAPSRKDPAAVPLTLLSGFLGAGKTTLLNRIISNKDGVKCAMIVNDLASVNVDAHTVGKNVKGDDTLVHLENGCICCDLNEEFVKQVVSLSRSGQFDYILVENTGVADPEPVAESLVDESLGVNDVEDAAVKLTDIVKLDTCVTVVDASAFYKHLHSSKRLKDTKLGENVETEEAEGLISQVLANQIEYADVVALNKTDLIPADKLADIREAIQALNPKATVIPCTFGKIDLKQLLGTGRFSRSTTAAKPLAPGQAIRDSNFEDAVTSFVYTARTPFHPGRLHAFVTKHFHLHQRDFSADIVSEQDDAMTTLKEATAAIATAVKVLPAHSAAVRLAAELATKAAEAAMVGGARASGDAPKKVPEQLKAKAPASKAKPFGLLLRSKGQAWLAGPARHDHMAECSLAGDVLQFSTAGPWAASLPVEYWPEDEEPRAAMLADMEPGIGDRKQELVFIGMGLNEKKLRAALDGCLCTAWELVEGVDSAKDPFAAWPPIVSMLPAVEEEEEDGEGSDEEMSSSTDEESKSEAGDTAALEE